MAKLFKNSKQILTFVVAFAIFAVSLFAGGIVADAQSGQGTTEALCKGTRIEFWDGTRDNNLTGEGTKDDPYIIKTAAQLNYVCAVAGNNTVTKYYKVDPDIKAFILQSSATVDALGGASKFMNIVSAEETRVLFEETAVTKGVALYNWLKNGANVFDGDFDGSGVEIYGLYADAATMGYENCGLFPAIDGGGDADFSNNETDSEGITVENLLVKNSYFKGFRRVGVISGASWWKGSVSVKVDGIVNVKNCEVSNCFLVGQDLKTNNNIVNFGNAEMGILGGSMNNDPVKVSYCTVYGNDSEYRVYGSASSTTYRVDANKKFNRVFALNTANSDPTLYGEIHNSIALDAIVNSFKANTDQITYCSNVYSNINTNLDGVTVIENGYGPEGQAEMSNFDWENTWFMGYCGPTLRAFHGKISLSRNNKTHCHECEDCGFKSYGGEEKHVYDVADVNDDYICTVCSYQCFHNVDYIIDDAFEGDCVTPPGIYFECFDCGRVNIETVLSAPGHQLEWVKEDPADCMHEGGVEGRKGFWHCTVCGGMFIEEAEVDAKMSKNSLGTYFDGEEIPMVADLVIPLAPHNATNREDGSILVKCDETGHWWICYTCDGRLLAVESKKYAEEGKVKKHKYEKGVCVDCGWECTEHNYEETGFTAVVGTCFVDQEEELKCTICGDKKSIVTASAGHKIEKVAEVAATDRLEGTKEHYICTVCKEVYVDAQGNTKATQASLVIPKTLPAGYENVQIDGGNTGNIDTSNKSPSTGDSLASVLTVAALVGAALVIARKK